MSNLTLFSIVKPFDDPHIARIQTNAIRSWQRMQPTPEIIIFGDKPGVKDACKALGVIHVPKIKKNERGWEIVTDAFEQAWKKGSGDIQVYLNADMILPPTFPYTLASIRASRYLMVGQRHNTPVEFDLDFTIGWWGRLRAHANATGHRHTVNGIDYFVHQRGMFAPMPELFVGNWYWDNVMIGLAQQANIPVIDATEAVFAIHQQHDYSHVEGGLNAIAVSPESLANKAHLPGGIVRTIADADMKLLPAF